MKQIWIIYVFTFLLLGLSFTSNGSEVPLSIVFDGRPEDSLPANFRTPKSPSINLKEIFTDLNEGLDEIQASGSGQFSESSFAGLIKALSLPNIVVIDLRQESHGLINGRAMSWTDGQRNWANENRSLKEIERDEKQRLEQAAKKGIIMLNAKPAPQEVIVQSAQTEKEFVESFGLNYIRIPVQDHCRPSDQAVDQFIQFVVNLPSDTWLHFHCRAGKGRTTTFLTLYDMMLNANRVDLESILTRHKLIGGTDLLRLHEPDNYKHYPAIARLEFVKRFYEYCRQVPDFHVPWSEWAAAQAISANN